MGSSNDQERWEKNDQELKRLSKAIEEINQKQNQTDDKLAAIMESQTKLISLFGSKSEEIPRKQPAIHTLDHEEWLKQYNGLTIAIVNHLIEDTEDKKENVKSIFQESPESVPCSKENTICEDVHEESIKAEDKGEEVRELDNCKVQLTDEEEPLKSQEGGLRVVGKDRKRSVQIKRKKLGFQWKRKEGIKKQETMEKKHQEKTRKRKKIRKMVQKVRYLIRKKFKQRKETIKNGQKEKIMKQSGLNFRKRRKASNGYMGHCVGGSGGGPGCRWPMWRVVGQGGGLWKSTVSAVAVKRSKNRVRKGKEGLGFKKQLNLRWMVLEMAGVRQIVGEGVSIREKKEARDVVGFFWVAGGSSSIFFGLFKKQLNVREEGMRREKQENSGGGPVELVAGNFLGAGRRNSRWWRRRNLAMDVSFLDVCCGRGGGVRSGN